MLHWIPTAFALSHRTNEQWGVRCGIETCALETVGARFIQDVAPGEVVIISDEGLKIEVFTTEVQPAICAMEYIYFARPDSNIAGVNVHTARKRMGKNLAIESPVAADMVIGVPNSSLSAASGYAEEAQIPYELGLVKINMSLEHSSSRHKIKRTRCPYETIGSSWRGQRKKSF